MKKILIAFTFFLVSSSTSHAEIPGLKGPDHIGFTVPNLDEAVRFFVDVIGCEAFYQMGPFKDPEGNWMTDNLRVHPRTEITRMQLVRCKNGSNLEIFEYSAPDQNKQLPKNSDIGGSHIGFYVDDMDVAIAYLKAQGVEMLGEPTVTTQGPSTGETWQYFLTPWGMSLELVSYPNGKAYEKDYKNKLFSPND
jgi:catechol 2,3-dioxygenase-like lactoylglutathione lyase family enzyme